MSLLLLHKWQKTFFGHSFSIPQWKPKTRFSRMFGNNHAPKKYQHYLQVIFELQGPSTGWFGQNLWITGVSKFFVWLNEVPRKFLSLKNMWNLATFLLLANFLSGTISRGPLTRRKCYFSFFNKKPVLKIFFHCFFMFSVK